MTQDTRNKIGEWLIKNSGLLIAVLGAAVTWGSFIEKFSQIEARQDQIEIQKAKIEAKLEEQEKQYNDLDKKLERITTILEERLPPRKTTSE